MMRMDVRKSGERNKGRKEGRKGLKVKTEERGEELAGARSGGVWGVCVGGVRGRGGVTEFRG